MSPKKEPQFFARDVLGNRRHTFRIPTVVDQHARECVCAHADRSQAREKVSEELDSMIALHGAPESITSDGWESDGQAMDYWIDQIAVKLDFIRPGKSV